ncbi:MAG: gamma-glutamylcyclotransferase [Chloroflexi bacterium]|nr:MAG: gamma-glutamylcyclotransferase [Chloroflexota bacterium]
MFNILFTYGTLQYPDVQQAVFGRVTQMTPDILDGFIKEQIVLGDNSYPIIRQNPKTFVIGKRMQVTPEELVLIDRYETSAYRRIRVTLRSGLSAWVYCE